MQNTVKAGLSRRKFLFGSAAALTAPLILPSRLFGQNAPSNTLNVGIVGCGNRFRTHQTIGQIPGVRVVAVCDVWDERATVGKAQIDETNGDAHCKTYGDFRDLIADSEVDMVVVGAPDHWHALIAIAAANAGKHIYLEKPFAYSVEEGRAVINAVRRNGVILQHGTQQRSSASFQRATYLAQGGLIGNVDTVYAISHPGPSGGDPSKRQIPAGYNYDLFTGPAPKTPFYLDMITRSGTAARGGTPAWYFTSVFGGGWVTAWGSHHVDSAQFALGKDHEAPVKIEAKGLYPETGMFDTAYSWYAELTYADGKKIIYCTPDRPECPKIPGADIIVVGETGWVAANRGKVWSSQPGLTERNWPKDNPALQLMDRGGQMDHFKSLVDAIRYGTPVNAPMEIGQLSTTLCHLTSIGIETQRPLNWNSSAERFVDDPQADRLLGRSMRAPWTLA
jgi:myo-inositol 2-dehydrogenase/D-chiro-inositol 1-dehydrogenase